MTNLQATYDAACDASRRTLDQDLAALRLLRDASPQVAKTFNDFDAACAQAHDRHDARKAAARDAFNAARNS